MRGEIEQAFDMHAVDIYGLSEVMDWVANECVETKDSLHLGKIILSRNHRSQNGRGFARWFKRRIGIYISD